MRELVRIKIYHFNSGAVTSEGYKMISHLRIKMILMYIYNVGIYSLFSKECS